MVASITSEFLVSYYMSDHIGIQQYDVALLFHGDCDKEPAKEFICFFCRRRINVLQLLLAELEYCDYNRVEIKGSFAVKAWRNYEICL